MSVHENPTTYDMLAMQRDILKQIAHARTSSLAYLGPVDFVYQEGQRYTKFAPYDADFWGFEGEPQSCFQNAYLLAELHPDTLTYVEGYACGFFAIPHAWCITADGTVIDPTWETEQQHDYFGVPFNLAFVDETTDARGMYGVIDDWQNDWPLCQQPFDRERCGA